jgi:ribosomal protein S30
MQNPDIDLFQKHNIAPHVKNTKNLKPSGNKPMLSSKTGPKAMIIFPC